MGKFFRDIFGLQDLFLVFTGVTTSGGACKHVVMFLWQFVAIQ